MIALVVELVRWLLGFALLWRRRGLPVDPDAGDDILGDVAVVIPARNEAGVIGGLLRTVPAGVEVVVVDDGSGDGTAEEARSLGVAVLDPGPPPPGWVGKSWACAAGAAATTGPILVFLDADVRLRDGALQAVAMAAGASGGLVSVQPHHQVGSRREELSAYFNVVGLMGVGAFAAIPIAVAAAFGPVLALPRELYDRVGGHGAVRDDILDDVALARAVRAAGGPLTLHTGGESVAFRMYPGGARQLVEGWTKNFAAGASAVPVPLVLLVVLWLSGVISAAVAPVLAALGSISSAWAIALYVGYGLQAAVLFRRAGSFGGVTAALFPVPLAVFLAVFLRSVVLTFGVGRVTWRGRSVEVRRR